MLTIEIKLNGNLIGGAQVRNVSQLADISDYEVTAVEQAAPWIGPETNMHETFKIERHFRQQSVWALVKKVADKAFDLREKGLGL
ncbi:hypothetical protein ACM25O_13235 [Sulfitobacter pontiacus]